MFMMGYHVYKFLIPCLKSRLKAGLFVGVLYFTSQHECHIFIGLSLATQGKCGARCVLSCQFLEGGAYGKRHVVLKSQKFSVKGSLWLYSVTTWNVLFLSFLYGHALI
jgi:hypothetical protein